MGERDWSFTKAESASVDSTRLGKDTVLEYFCKSFSPKAFDFHIKYDYPSSSRFPIRVSSETRLVSYNKSKHSITVSYATDLHIQFPAKGEYVITNITGKAVKGLDCDTGFG